MNFNIKTVGKITGLTARRLDYWDRSNFIKPSVQEASGQGSVRLYSFTDLIQMKVAKMLLDKGVSLQELRKAITYLKKHMKEIERPLAQLRFLTDGETIFVLAKDNQQIIDTLKGGQLVFSIALGEIVQDLKTSVDAIQEKKSYSVSIGNRKYQVTLHQDSEGSLYRAACPEFLGCTSQGDTVEETLEMIRDTIRGTIEGGDEQKTAGNIS